MYILQIYIYICLCILHCGSFLFHPTNKKRNKQTIHIQSSIAQVAGKFRDLLSVFVLDKIAGWGQTQDDQEAKVVHSKSLDFLPFEHKVLLANHVATCPDFKASQ